VNHIFTLICNSIVLLLLFFAGATRQAEAQDVCTWTGNGTDNSWHTPENWACDAHDGIPTATDAVTIAPEGTVTVNLGADAEVWSLELGIDDGESPHSEAHVLTTTVDDIELTASGGAVIVRQTGRFNLGRARVASGVGAQSALRATLISPEPVLVHGRLWVANSTILTDVTLNRPDIGGARGYLQARGWNNIYGTLHVVDGFLQPVVPGGWHGSAAPHLRVVDHDLIVTDGSSVQIFADQGAINTPAITVEGGIFDHRGGLTTSSFPNSVNAPFAIDALVVNQGVMRTRLARPPGLSFRGPDGAVHQNSGLLEIGALLSSDIEDDAIDGFGFLVEAGRELHNTGEIKIHRLRTAEGVITNTDGGTITDETEVDEADTYTLGFAGPQAVEIHITDPGTIERLFMTWHGEDHPDAVLDQNIENTNHWWDLSATTSDSVTASGIFSLSLPHINSGIPQVCRFREDPAGWDCFITSLTDGSATVHDVNQLSEWAVANFPSITTDDHLDPGFGDDGVVQHTVQDRDQAHAIVLEPDGSIITFGQSSVFGDIPNTRGGTFTHFDPDGTVIESRLYRAFANGCGDVPQVFLTGAKLDNGQFIVAGYRQIGCSGTPRYFVVMRLHADGSLDHIFDDAVFYNNVAIAYDLAVQSDGKFVAVGTASTSSFELSTYNAAIARYNEDGTVDTEFGNNGEAVFDIDDDYDSFRAVALQEDGKIIAGGFATTLTGRDFLMMRLNADGSLDTEFGTDGTVLQDFNGSDDYILDIGMQEDGKIVVAGRSTDADDTTIRFTIARYNTDGTPDIGFADNGIALVDFGSPSAFASALKIDPSGMMYVAGTTESGGGGEDTRTTALAVLRPDGSLESDFGDDGKQVFGFGVGPIDVASALDIDPVSGRIAIAGYTGARTDGDLAIEIGVARLIGMPSDNPTDIAISEDLPSIFTLYQNYPNPFNPSTLIRYDIPVASYVLLEVYNVLGQKVAVLVDEFREAGNYSTQFDAGHLPSGTYYYRIQAGDFMQMKKLMLIK
jgi:uncharacterized delta-60 repeat protein